MNKELDQIKKVDQEKWDKKNLEIDIKLKNELKVMQENCEKNEEKVVKMLLDAVCAVEPKVHPNYVLRNNVATDTPKSPATSFSGTSQSPKTSHFKFLSRTPNK